MQFVLKEDKKEGLYGYERYNKRAYDPDFEDPPRDALDRMKEAYGQKQLYHLGSWYCKEYGKSRVLGICKKEGIPFDTVSCIYKRLNGYWRDYGDFDLQESIRDPYWNAAVIRFKDVIGEIGDNEEEEEDDESVGSE